MQVAKGSKFRNPTECVKLTLAKEGWFGLLRGTGATMMREVPGNAIFFTSYEILRRYLPGRSESHHRPRSFSEIVMDSTSAIFCGGISGIIMWSAILPLDVSKTRLQSSFPGDKHDLRISQQLKQVRFEEIAFFSPLNFSYGKKVVSERCIPAFIRR